jgi:hypothetical protein
MKAGVTDSVAAAEAAGLGIPWVVSLYMWLSTAGLLPATPLEDVMFTLVVVRALLYLSVGSIRRMHPGKSVIFFSGDVLILPVCALGFLVTGDISYGAFGRDFLASWLSAGLVVYPSVAITGLVGAVRSRSRLSAVIPATAITFGASSLVVQSLAGGAQPFGLSEVADLALGAFRKPLAADPGASEFMAVCGALLFAALAVYAATMADQTPGRLAPRLGVGVLGIAGLVIWLSLSPSLSAWFLIGLPIAAVVGAVWVVSREP